MLQNRWWSLSALVLLSPLAVAQNKIVRTPPSSLAARSGSAVKWRGDLDAALAEAKEKHKLVFWYVPTVQGSPMDRKPEIDRYLMAGPFSWPSTIELLNQHFVPVHQIAKGEVQKTYGLVRGKFIEPGWLVLDGEGKEVARLDQLTTFHPQWFEAPLRRLSGQPAAGFLVAPALQEAWDAYRVPDLAKARELAAAVLQQKPSAPVAAEARFLVGAALCRDNQREAAKKAWTELAEALPEQPFAWKAAMEAEDHGPFGHGFEDYGVLKPGVLKELADGSRAPHGTFTEEELWQCSLDFLLRMDDGDGELRDSIYDFGGNDSLPNVYVAVSCLAGQALLSAQKFEQAGKLALRGGTKERIEAMLQRLLHGACDDTRIATADRDEILWAYSYRMRFLAQWLQQRPADKQDLAKQLQNTVSALEQLQPENGAWFHEYANPFAMATALVALSDAKAQGAIIDQTRIERGVRAMLKCRTDKGTYSYGFPGNGKPQSVVEAAAGRMPLCELALRSWQQGSDEQLAAALKAAFEYHGLMAEVRKYDDHASRYTYGGFFFWYDMLGRTEALMRQPAGPVREQQRAQQLQLVLDLPEFDGCFVDSHELGRTYGTAMGLLCLASLRG